MHWPDLGGLASRTAGTRANILVRVRLLKPVHATAWLRTKNGRYIAILSATLTATLVVLSVTLWPAPAAPKSAWYMDLSTGDLFVADYGLMAPIAAPSGKLTDQGQTMGVRAHVFSRGSCWWPWSRYVGYLETTAPQAKAAAKSPFFATVSAESQLRVSSPDHPGDWVDMNSPAGNTIMGAGMQADARGRLAHECYP